MKINASKNFKGFEKSGFQGNKMWTAHRMSAFAKNKSIKPIRKEKKGKSR